MKTLARKAGLDPTVAHLSGAEDPALRPDQALVHLLGRGELPKLRKFINLLELSDSFLTLEEVTLSEGTAAQPGRPGRGSMAPVPQTPGSELRINLTLSTLFAKDPNGMDDDPAARRAAS